MKISEFNCVEMKHRGAEKVLEQIAEMTREQELEFWRVRTQNLVAHKFDMRNKPFVGQHTQEPSKDAGLQTRLERAE